MSSYQLMIFYRGTEGSISVHPDYIEGPIYPTLEEAQAAADAVTTTISTAQLAALCLPLPTTPTVQASVEYFGPTARSPRPVMETAVPVVPSAPPVFEDNPGDPMAGTSRAGLSLAALRRMAGEV